MRDVIMSPGPYRAWALLSWLLREEKEGAAVYWDWGWRQDAVTVAAL